MRRWLCTVWCWAAWKRLRLSESTSTYTIISIESEESERLSSCVFSDEEEVKKPAAKPAAKDTAKASGKKKRNSDDTSDEEEVKKSAAKPAAPKSTVKKKESNPENDSPLRVGTVGRIIFPIDGLVTFFKMLPPKDLKNAVLVCTDWRREGQIPSLWSWVSFVLTPGKQRDSGEAARGYGGSRSSRWCGAGQWWSRGSAASTRTM